LYRVGDPFTFEIPHGTSEYWNIFNTLFKVQRSAKSMGWDMGIAPDISRFFDAVAGKRLIKKSIF
jgi:hypothetical protein